MNGSKPRGPSGGFQTPTPKRRRQGLWVSCSPSPRPLPQGEGETFARALVIGPSSVVVCLRNERQGNGDCTRNARIFPHRANALPLLVERVVLAASPLESATEDGPEGYMALSHSSIQASGLAGGRGQIILLADLQTLTKSVLHQTARQHHLMG